MGRTAFAIAGVGGNNAYGAGFLAAAQQLARRNGHDDGLWPGLEMITCTSGAIASTAAYLRGDDLRKGVETAVDRVIRSTVLPREALAEPVRLPLILGWAGLPGIFAPYWLAVAEHLVGQAVDFMTKGRPPVATPVDLVNTFLPARMFIPERPQHWFADCARTLVEAPIGVAFNSFDPTSGEEYLYLNERGLALVAEHHDPDAAYGRERKRTRYAPITPEAVENALWLLWYGFEKPGQHIDGCYGRSIILNEVTFAERVLVVKPINDRWLGQLPRNVFEVLDMQTELWMGTSYRQQVQQIDLVNHLLETGRLLNPESTADDGTMVKRYHEVGLVPVELERKHGLFSHFVEDLDVFDAAYARSREVLASLG